MRARNKKNQPIEWMTRSRPNIREREMCFENDDRISEAFCLKWMARIDSRRSLVILPSYQRQSIFLSAPTQMPFRGHHLLWSFLRVHEYVLLLPNAGSGATRYRSTSVDHGLRLHRLPSHHPCEPGSKLCSIPPSALGTTICTSPPRRSSPSLQ
jgi:hypothetical protein